MADAPSVLRKATKSSKVLGVIGIGLLVTGFIAFLNTLGSGGGYFAAAVTISGAALILVSIVQAIVHRRSS
jgi:hypothetical protein